MVGTRSGGDRLTSVQGFALDATYALRTRAIQLVFTFEMRGHATWCETLAASILREPVQHVVTEQSARHPLSSSFM
jgi:hypothetical protein